MSRRTLEPSWIASAALTVLASGAVAAVTLSATPGTLAAPPVEGRFVAASETAPAPLTMSFPAPAAESVEAPARAAVRVAAPAAPAARVAARVNRTTRTTRATAPAPVAAPRTAGSMCEGAGWENRRGQAAIAKLRRPSDARAVPVAFRAARPDVLGLTDMNARKVDVFVRSCAKLSDSLLLHVVAHELGHITDAVRLDNAMREEWKKLRGIPASTPWFGCNRCNDFATPAGDFAETYAQWQRGSTSSRSQLARPATQAELAAFAQRFFRPL